MANSGKRIELAYHVARETFTEVGVDTQQALEQGLTMKHVGEAMHAAASLRAGITLAHGLVAHNIDRKLSM